MRKSVANGKSLSEVIALAGGKLEVEQILRGGEDVHPGCITRYEPTQRR